MSTVVVTALYNGAPWIRETLDAVHNQTHPPQEHWVIDDGSTDNSVALVEAHGLSKLVRNPHRGPNAARNHAIRETRSKYIAILDQDDVWHPEHLALLEDALEKNPDAPAAFSRMQQFSTGEQTAYRIENGDPQSFDPWERFPINTIDTPAQVLMRRKVLIAAGGWPTHIVGAADYFTWLRISIEKPLLALPSLTVGYRQHRSSYSNTMRGQHRSKFFESYLAAAQEVPQRTKSMRRSGRTFVQWKTGTLSADVRLAGRASTGAVSGRRINRAGAGERTSPSSMRLHHRALEERFLFCGSGTREVSNSAPRMVAPPRICTHPPLGSRAARIAPRIHCATRAKRREKNTTAIVAARYFPNLIRRRLRHERL